MVGGTTWHRPAAWEGVRHAASAAGPQRLQAARKGCPPQHDCHAAAAAAAFAASPMVHRTRPPRAATCRVTRCQLPARPCVTSKSPLCILASNRPNHSHWLQNFPTTSFCAKLQSFSDS